MPKKFLLLLSIFIAAANVATAQTGTAAAAAAGASLAANASQSGAAASASAANSPGSASQAPIEVQIMVYGGLKQIARHIADDATVALESATSTGTTFKETESIEDSTRRELDTKESPWQCTDEDTVATVLLQDPTSSAQIALYKTFDAYYSTLAASHDELIKLLTEKKTELAAAQRKEIEDLQNTIKDMQEKMDALNSKIQQQAATKQPKIRPNDQDFQILDKDISGAKDALNRMVIEAGNPVGGGGGTTGGGTTPTTPGGSTGGGSSSATPPSMQYLSGIGTEVTAAKEAMSYASSSVQALSQMLTTELGRDLCQNHIQLRTSTSTLNLDEAAADITKRWKDQQEKGGTLARLIAWQQKPVKDSTGKVVNKTVPDTDDLIATSDGVVLGTGLANAVTAFQTWLTTGDQMGGIILTDVLKGEQLTKDAKASKLPALQVSIDAAGGNTRTNSFPLLNFFYLPRPSFNAGVVVTYELRDGNNDFLAGDTKKVIYGYSKWKAEQFCMKEEVSSVELDTGRPSKPDGKKCRN
jgi:hypothetical protein